MNMEPLTAVLGPLLSGGVVLWFIRRGFSQLDKTLGRIRLRLERVERKQEECRLETVRDLATRKEAGELRSRIEDHHGRLVRLEAR